MYFQKEKKNQKGDLHSFERACRRLHELSIESEFHEPLHCVGDSETGLGHELSRLFSDLRIGLNLAECVGMIAKFPKDVFPLRNRTRRQVVFADSNDTGDDGDDLRKVFI